MRRNSFWPIHSLLSHIKLELLNSSPWKLWKQNARGQWLLTNLSSSFVFSLSFAKRKPSNGQWHFSVPVTKGEPIWPSRTLARIIAPDSPCPTFGTRNSLLFWMIGHKCFEESVTRIKELALDRVVWNSLCVIYTRCSYLSLYNHPHRMTYGLADSRGVSWSDLTGVWEYLSFLKERCPCIQIHLNPRLPTRARSVGQCDWWNFSGIEAP